MRIKNPDSAEVIMIAKSEAVKNNIVGEKEKASHFVNLVQNKLSEEAQLQR